MTFGCNAQNSVSTNEIFSTEGIKVGVKSKEGKILIEPIYKHIRILMNHDKLTLPPKEGREGTKNLEYYLVSNSDNQKALFDKNGKVVFDFCDCVNIVVDQYTQTAVISKKIPNYKQPRSFLHKLNGGLLFESSFENIAYINNSNLIALIAQDSPDEEFYLFNPFSKKKIGPFDHFNIYSKDMSPFGLSEMEFEKSSNLNTITIRKEVDNDYIWGMIDFDGKEILPMEYRYLQLFLTQEKKHPSFKRADKPEGIDFLFRGTLGNKPSKSILFDSNFDKYEFKISPRKGEYKIEKM